MHFINLCFYRVLQNGREYQIMYPGRPGAKSPSANGPTNKPQVVSDQQAREKLAVSTPTLILNFNLN